MACRTSASQTKSTGCGFGGGAGEGAAAGGCAGALALVSQLYPPEPVEAPRPASRRSTTSAATLAMVDSFVGAGVEHPQEDPAAAALADTATPRDARYFSTAATIAERSTEPLETAPE